MLNREAAFGKENISENTLFKWDYCLKNDTQRFLSNKKSERKESTIAVLNSFLREASTRADSREV